MLPQWQAGGRGDRLVQGMSRGRALALPPTLGLLNLEGPDNLSLAEYGQERLK